MQKNEKIGIAIVAILIIVLAIIIWDKQNTINPKVEVNCEIMCHKIGNNNWTFPGTGPISENVLPTKEDCISACQDKFRK